MTRLPVTGLELPVIQTPITSIQDSALALAVCNAGSFGSLLAAMQVLDEPARQFGLLAAGRSRP